MKGSKVPVPEPEPVQVPVQVLMPVLMPVLLSTILCPILVGAGELQRNLMVLYVPHRMERGERRE